MTGTGPVVVLPNRFAHEVRNNKSLSFNRYFDKDFFVNYPGFEAYRTGYKDGTFIQEVVRTKLTQSLALVTKDLVDEMTDASTSEVVAKLSSRFFLGKNLARNDKWLRIAASYTHDSYSAAHELRQWNMLLRPFVSSFLPNLGRLRREVQEATSLIMPDGSLIKKGTRVMVSASTFMDPEVYPDPEKYDIYRFYNLRSSPGQENAYQYVQTSPEHCRDNSAPPGRSKILCSADHMRVQNM
ncbi:hypothetical protein FJTKL_15640 [Diaporthe vaccinii]|uniref:Cytochrome P450 n=1 Tax=Diaporthe vaccinii TaxID=105482 RepID=A0ABR4F7D2_9PEZI